MTENNEPKKEEKIEGTEEKTTTENSDVGESVMIQEAKKAAEELKKQNEIKAKLIEREEKLLARQETLKALGGGSQAGQAPAKPKEETPKEYADRILSGRA